ncbi:MAG: N-acetylmuramoyl-L-alanine amidase [Bacteroidales bacterium]|nr:N-acetylmuramoyl-L-alanine amidase [Bacteroidales bacterium]
MNIRPCLEDSVHTRRRAVFSQRPPERCRRVNEWCRQLGKDNVLLISIHCNAAQVHIPGHRIRTDYTDADPDLKKDFYILRHTLAPAVPVENLFMDNPSDCAFLLSPEGQQSLVDLHVDGICAWLDSKDL